MGDRGQGNESGSWNLRDLTRAELIRTVFRSCREHDLHGRAAQLSFFLLLALFPLLIFLSALLGRFLADEREVLDRLLGYLGSIMPPRAYELVGSTVADIVKGTSGGKVSVGLALALWTGSSGLVAVIDGLNIAYRVPEKRRWWRRRLLALILTICLGVLITAAMLLLLAGDKIEDYFSSTGAIESALGATSTVLQWTIAVGCMVLALFAIYRFAPNLANQGVVAILPGAIVALAGWVLASIAFRTYLSIFGSFRSQTYGSLGGVIVLLLWLYLTAASILVGGEVNSAIRGARRDVD